ncbi:hypothetical protein [Ralstonia solanacearum]|uniref:hypothetical protein n=1 Tax=Ralstonia solanacearum TaxID=305 RepID=UPI003D2D423C
MSLLVSGYMAWMFSNDGALARPLDPGGGVVHFLRRQLRAMENIVHFGSHLNITSKRKVNDVIVNLAALIRTFNGCSDIGIHNKHHVLFAGHDDPARPDRRHQQHSRSVESRHSG